MATSESAPVRLNRHDSGKGPAVVLLHGLGLDHSLWDPQREQLSTSFRVLAPDLRGHGATPAPPGSTFSFPEFQADVIALLDELGIERAHMVGFSAGGFLALRMAVHAPTRLESLTTIAAAPHCDAHTRAMGESWAESYREGGYDAYALRLLKDLYYPDWIEDHLDVADQLRERKDVDLHGAIRWALAVGSFDLRGQLGRIRVPTLVLHGMDDRVVDPAHARLLRQSITGAQLRLFAQTGHMVPVERPEETTQAIREFFEKVPSP
ncbi:MAG: alpha/beta fold hydrolase [Thermoplasmata archaeon]